MLVTPFLCLIGWTLSWVNDHYIAHYTCLSGLMCSIVRINALKKQLIEAKDNCLDTL